MSDEEARRAGGIAWRRVDPPMAAMRGADRPATTPEMEEPEECDQALLRALNAAKALRARRQRELVEHVELLAEAAGFTMGQVRGRGRQADLVEMRRILVRFLRDRGLSLPEIGRMLDRDHTSIHYLLSTPGPRPAARRTVAA